MKYDTEQVRAAIEQWIAFGTDEWNKSHQGYFSSGGWAYEVLRWLASEYPKLREDAERHRTHRELTVRNNASQTSIEEIDAIWAARDAITPEAFDAAIDAARKL